MVDKLYLFIQQQKSLEVFRIVALISGVTTDFPEVFQMVVNEYPV